MFLMPKWATALVLAAALFCRSAFCYGTALSVTPSTSWYGDDGSWSAVSLRVGSPPQWVDVMVSTVSAEAWVIGTGGCNNNDTMCSTLRGGVFDSNSSSTWSPLGFYQLGLDTQLGFGGYGYYGFDDLTFGTTGVALSSTIIASINTTAYWLGFLGLGIVPGNFTTITAISPISALVEMEDAIPSHSYGYTAGAIYQMKGQPCSLTLGGYDANRLVPHNVTFNLNPSQQPETYLNEITLVSPNATLVSSNASSNGSSPTQLLAPSDRVYATIDSSTPFLWLPESVCDRFAKALQLSYNTSLNLYTFDANPNQHNVLTNSQLTFAFSLSDFSGPETSQLINITIPYAAFDLQLTYPSIPNTTYGSANSTKYYFPLRRATNQAQFTIGRAFLQEAYLITDYERNTFSVHQAVHIADPIGNTSIISIFRPYDTSFSWPAESQGGLSKPAIVGVAIGSVVFVILLGLLFFFIRHRLKYGDEKGTRAPVLSLLQRSSRRDVLSAQKTNECSTNPDAGSASGRYELPAPLGPSDLNSDSNTLSGTTEVGTSSQEYHGLSAYQRVRRKMVPQQAMSQTSSPYMLQVPYHKERNGSDMSLNSHHQLSSTTDVESHQASSTGPGSCADPLTISTASSPVTQNSVPGPISPVLPPYQQVDPGEVTFARSYPDTISHPDTLQSAQGNSKSAAVGNPNAVITQHGISSLGSQHQHRGYEYLYGDGDTIESGSYINSERGSMLTPEDQREIDDSKFLREDIKNLRSNIKNRQDHRY
ncbi:hypothetical protein B7463_g6169, partial [Scytalidium lignicola]